MELIHFMKFHERSAVTLKQAAKFMLLLSRPYERDGVDHRLLIRMNFLYRINRRIQPVHAAGDFHLQLRLRADLTDAADVGGSPFKRPPHPCRANAYEKQSQDLELTKR